MGANVVCLAAGVAHCSVGVSPESFWHIHIYNSRVFIRTGALLGLLSFFVGCGNQSHIVWASISLMTNQCRSRKCAESRLS